MVGQQKLFNMINEYTLQTLPRTILLCGDTGSGRHTFISEMANKFNLPLMDITSDISLELINDIQTKSFVQFYLIDVDKLTEKEENVILKFIEEPPKTAYIVLICRNKSSVIPTVLNRCQIWNMEEYSDSQLMGFLPDGCKNPTFLLSVVRTPGSLMKQSAVKIMEMRDLADKMVMKIGGASFANILKIGTHVAFKESDDGYDFDIFVKIILNELKSNLIQTADVRLSNAYMLTNRLLNDSKILHIDKKILFENYLLNLKWCMIKK